MKKQSTVLLVTKALLIRYPTVLQILGTDMFNEMAKAYFSLNEFKLNSTSLDVDSIGENLDKFVGIWKGAKQYPYLSGVCSLEWQVETMPRYEEKRSTLGLIWHILFTSKSQLSLQLSPNVRLFEFEAGEVGIWLSYQSRHEPNQQNQLMSRHWMLRRNNQGLSLTPVSAKEYLFLSQLTGHHSLISLASRFKLSSVRPLISGLVQERLAKVAL